MKHVVERRKHRTVATRKAVLFFTLEENFPIGCVMDMLDDDMEMLLLYHGTSKADPKIHHCCFFASPRLGQSMYKVNMVSQTNGFVEGISVTIYDSIDIWEDELESDLLVHEAAFDFIEAMTVVKLLSVFCKMNYDEHWWLRCVAQSATLMHPKGRKKGRGR